jgi:hypothetical protein
MLDVNPSVKRLRRGRRWKMLMALEVPKSVVVLVVETRSSSPV